jgi:hypothetical protein
MLFEAHVEETSLQEASALSSFTARAMFFLSSSLIAGDIFIISGLVPKIIAVFILLS